MSFIRVRNVSRKNVTKYRQKLFDWLLRFTVCYVANPVYCDQRCALSFGPSIRLCRISGWHLVTV